MSLNRYLIQDRSSQTSRSGCSLIERLFSSLRTLGGFFGAFTVLVVLVSMSVMLLQRGDGATDRAKLLEASDDYIETMRDLVRADPKAVKALLGAEVIILFGRPQFERNDQGGIVWQYKTKSCIIDLFFFPKENEPMEKAAVNYADLRDGRGQPLKDESVPQCFKDLTSLP